MGGVIALFLFVGGIGEVNATCPLRVGEPPEITTNFWIIGEVTYYDGSQWKKVTQPGTVWIGEYPFCWAKITPSQTKKVSKKTQYPGYNYTMAIEFQNGMFWFSLPPYQWYWFIACVEINGVTYYGYNHHYYIHTAQGETVDIKVYPGGDSKCAPCKVHTR